MNNKYVSELIKNNLSKGEYTCIIFTVTSQKERDNCVLFFQKYKDIISDQGLVLERHTDSTCYTILTVKGYYRDFVVYDSGDGTYMTCDFNKRHPNYIMSPLMTCEECMSYIEKHMNISKIMYKPRKIIREI